MLDFIKSCITAVQAEIDAATNGRGSERSIRVVNGRFQRTTDERHVYVFNVVREMTSSYDDAPVKLMVSGHEVGGSIVGLGEFEVTVALDDYLGEYIAEAELIIDLTFILRKLKELLEGRISALVQQKIPRIAMHFDQAHIESINTAAVNEKFNDAQQEAINKCLGSNFLMVWGPPGTGKTYVLARLIREEVLAGRSVLLMSNTNVAVDQALIEFLKLCKADDKINSLFQQGKFVRLGIPQQENAEVLDLDNVVRKLNEDIRKILEEKKLLLDPLIEKLEKTERSAEHLLQLIDLRSKMEGLRSNLNAVKSSLSTATVEQQRIADELQKANTDLNNLQKKRGIGGIFAKFSKPGLQSRISILIKQSADASIRVQKLTSDKERAEKEWQTVEYDYQQLAVNAGNPDLWESQADNLEIAAKEQRSAIDLLKREITELEGRISGVRDQVVRDAQLIACTCAKSTLDKVVSSRQFDTVITDESSMISLPQALWCSSLAKEKFLCFGDFCQLPPISTIKGEDDPVNYKIMHSSIYEQNKINLSDESLNSPIIHMLDEQYRMADPICRLVSDSMYKGRLKTHYSVSRQDNPLTIISTSSFNAWCDKRIDYSWFNWHHAFAVVELVRQISIEQPDLRNKDNRIVVLSPYRAQVEIIKSLLKEASLSDIASVSTVWRSQGQEGGIVILDTVCAPPFIKPGRWFFDEPGLLDGARLFNVAVTRAKYRLYLIAHIDHLKRQCKSTSLSSLILSAMERNGRIIDSRELTEKSIPDTPGNSGGFIISTFPSGCSEVFDEDGFVIAFARDLSMMLSGSTITVFSPFLNDKSVAYWGPRFRAAIERGCRVEIFTRRPKQQSAFQFEIEVESLIKELESLGALVGFDSYVPGQKPMHHKIAILKFPDGSDAPIVWKGSMNALGHYRSEELMDRTQSHEVYDCISGLLKLAQMQAGLVGKELNTKLENYLCDHLNAVCPTHGLRMHFKFGRNARFKSYFMSCPRWKEKCPTINVTVDMLNRALDSIDARCLNEDCDASVEARTGRMGMYLKCSDGHFVNLSS